MPAATLPSSLRLQGRIRARRCLLRGPDRRCPGRGRLGRSNCRQRACARWPSPLEGLNARTYGPPGLEADIEFCSQVDLLQTVPRLPGWSGTPRRSSRERPAAGVARDRAFRLARLHPHARLDRGGPGVAGRARRCDRRPRRGVAAAARRRPRPGRGRDTRRARRAGCGGSRRVAGRGMARNAFSRAIDPVARGRSFE